MPIAAGRRHISICRVWVVHSLLSTYLLLRISDINFPTCIFDWPHKADLFMMWQRGLACKQVNEVLGERQDALCFLCWSSSGQMGEAQASHTIGKYGESQLFKHTARGGCNPMAAYIGVDVSKHVLDAQMGAHYFQVENTAKGLKKFIRALEKFIQSGNPVSTVVCEASGGYERD